MELMVQLHTIRDFSALPMAMLLVSLGDPGHSFLQRQSQLLAQSSCHSGTVLGPQSHLALQCVQHLLSEGGLEGIRVISLVCHCCAGTA